jgi:hypothetical protein
MLDWEVNEDTPDSRTIKDEDIKWLYDQMNKITEGTEGVSEPDFEKFKEA